MISDITVRFSFGKLSTNETVGGRGDYDRNDREKHKVVSVINKAELSPPMRY